MTRSILATRKASAWCQRFSRAALTPRRLAVRAEGARASVPSSYEAPCLAGNSSAVRIAAALALLVLAGCGTSGNDEPVVRVRGASAPRGSS